jgi:hypothetical protein
MTDKELCDLASEFIEHLAAEVATPEEAREVLKLVVCGFITFLAKDDKPETIIELVGEFSAEMFDFLGVEPNFERLH